MTVRSVPILAARTATPQAGLAVPSRPGQTPVLSLSHLLAHCSRLTNSPRQPWRTLERQQGVQLGLCDPNSPFLGKPCPHL